MRVVRHHLKSDVVDAMVAAAVTVSGVNVATPLVARAIESLRASLDRLEVPVSREEEPARG